MLESNQLADFKARRPERFVEPDFKQTPPACSSERDMGHHHANPYPRYSLNRFSNVLTSRLVAVLLLLLLLASLLLDMCMHGMPSKSCFFSIERLRFPPQNTSKSTRAPTLKENFLKIIRLHIT